MAVTVQASGSQTAVIGTEHDLATVTVNGVFEVNVDVAALADAATPDEVEIRIYGKARSTDPERLIRCDTQRGAQGWPLYKSLPILSPHHLRVTLKQTQGTARTFPWAIYAT